MKKLLLLLTIGMLYTACGVNRYGVGKYEGLTKTELKEEFKALKYTGVEDRVSVAMPINGLVTVGYQDPKDLAKSDDYIVTTKTSLSDIVIGAVTGGLYTQETIHVRSSLDSISLKKPKVSVKKKKASNVKVNGLIQFGSSINSLNGTEDWLISPESELNFNGSIGANIDFGKFFLRPTVQYELSNFKYGSGDFYNINESISWDSGKIKTEFLGLEVLGGYDVGNISIFSGVKAFGSVSDNISFSGAINGIQSFENRESFVGPGVLFSIPVGLEYNIGDTFAIQGKYYIPATKEMFDRPDTSLSSVHVGLIAKF